MCMRFFLQHGNTSINSRWTRCLRCVCVFKCVSMWDWDGDCGMDKHWHKQCYDYSLLFQLITISVCLFTSKSVMNPNFPYELLWFCHIRWKTIASSLLSIDYHLGLFSAIYGKQLIAFQRHTHTIFKNWMFTFGFLLFWY